VLCGRSTAIPEQRVGRTVFRDWVTAMHTEIDILEKPIERIRQTWNLMGMNSDFELKLTVLEHHLQALVAVGETDEGRLAVSGLIFLKQAT
jgi:hypothetical protein